MEQKPQTPQNHHYSINVDTSRPFRSVKEAVAIFGERLLAGDLHARPIATLHHKREPSPSWPSLSPSPSDYNKAEPKAFGEISVDYVSLESTVKKLEAELEETKEEVKMLKARESETGVALATLNSELHRSLAATDNLSVASRSIGLREEERMREIVMTRVEGLPTLAEILTSVNVGRDNKNKSSHYHNNKYFGNNSNYGFGENKERSVMIMKKKVKPIVPLVGDLFFSWKKKGSSTSLHNSLYSSQL